ncbi:SRPBCC family protein [Azotobacter salinestris]|uniref:SRPBCC family protein n=1 Tax=Azotobacter salinestris TaxID=69964 RepID=UPI001266A0C5|nr:SRPBCC family protein [Azotobacter salinestris]
MNPHPPLAAERIPPERLHQANVQGLERAASLAGGSLLIGKGLRRGGLGGGLQVILGGLALVRGLSGRCALKAAMQPSPLEQQLIEDTHWRSAKALARSITINRPREELYRYWRDFNNLPTFMTFLEHIEVLPGARVRWVARLPMGKTLEWTTHLTEDLPGERLAWESEANAPIRNLGRVTFRDAPDEQGTEIQALIAYEPPAGRVGHALAGLLDQLPAFKTAQDLRRLKQLMETGEIATSRMTRDARVETLQPVPPTAEQGIH